MARALASASARSEISPCEATGINRQHLCRASACETVPRPCLRAKSATALARTGPGGSPRSSMTNRASSPNLSSSAPSAPSASSRSSHREAPRIREPLASGAGWLTASAPRAGRSLLRFSRSQSSRPSPELPVALPQPARLWLAPRAAEPRPRPESPHRRVSPMPLVEVAGIRIGFERAGKGPPLKLVHGPWATVGSGSGRPLLRRRTRA
jgi:hypothetical protein